MVSQIFFSFVLPHISIQPSIYPNHMAFLARTLSWPCVLLSFLFLLFTFLFSSLSLCLRVATRASHGDCHFCVGFVSVPFCPPSLCTRTRAVRIRESEQLEKMAEKNTTGNGGGAGERPTLLSKPFEFFRISHSFSQIWTIWIIANTREISFKK